MTLPMKTVWRQGQKLIKIQHGCSLSVICTRLNGSAILICMFVEFTPVSFASLICFPAVFVCLWCRVPFLLSRFHGTIFSGHLVYICRSRHAPSFGFQCLYLRLRLRKLGCGPFVLGLCTQSFGMMESHSFAATHIPCSIENPVALRRACLPASYSYDCALIQSSHVDSECALSLGDSLYTHFHTMLMGQPTWMS